MSSEHEITSRIRRDELLGLLHATEREHQPDRITTRMPAITLEGLLIPDELPAPPFVIRFRSPSGTDQFERPLEATPCSSPTVTSDGTIADDIEPEVSVAIGRVTSQALDASLAAAIDAAVDETITAMSAGTMHATTDPGSSLGACDYALACDHVLATAHGLSCDPHLATARGAAFIVSGRPDIAEGSRNTGIISRATPNRLHMLSVLCGFALTFIAGIGLMALIG